jgi:hypothetical protein
MNNGEVIVGGRDTREKVGNMIYVSKREHEFVPPLFYFTRDKVSY